MWLVDMLRRLTRRRTHEISSQEERENASAQTQALIEAKNRSIRDLSEAQNALNSVRVQANYYRSMVKRHVKSD